MSEKVDGVAVASKGGARLYDSEPTMVVTPNEAEARKGYKLIVVNKDGGRFMVKTEKSLNDQAKRGVWITKAWNLYCDQGITEVAEAEAESEADSTSAKIEAIMSLKITDKQKADLIAKL